ncbi:MAG: phospho-N-acetylmuramoyl-pentapeptide-transferase [Candidatus Anoxymicrobium japonicum]|uniref:Phospho-N-acetylmuramoyl-pentapeptide-transferase n=1 Tax=Candidatus Anoxymicrobium japonicum TaxID=2013648 RepID=A0A2N3G852_9ACTN|nr:MAG: phospho-N-acetylmuramoyl-pentapeptide-transferase [Candidatus Anoxymicrobium japonicum]
MYRVLGAAIVAGLICLLSTPVFIKFLKRMKYGQVIREDGPRAHFVKKGTPTMGGILIVLGVVVGYLIFSKHTPEGLAVLSTMVACGLLGFIDDFTQIRKKRSLGLKPSYKFAGQLLIAAGFTVFATRMHTAGYPALPQKFSFLGGTGFSLGWFFFIWVFVMITASSNSVNLTDGLDGLASGATIIVMSAYLLIAFTMFRHPITEHPRFYAFTGKPALDVAIIAGAVLGACVGFLWWNAAPAKIFMGDTGSLALGGVLAAIAIMTRTQLLLPLLGGLFVLETASVIVQVGVFKITGGKRVFKMAPIHHHFELSGWSEFTVMVRLWIVCGFCMLVGFAIFYVDFVGRVLK